MKVEYAKVSFNQYGTPTSDKFDDVYFSNDDGIAETNYVFIEGNELNKRWLEFSQTTFIIGETGFGSGLNMLLAAEQFLQFKRVNPTHKLRFLHFFTFEQYPISVTDLKVIASQRPSLNNLYQALIAQYPLPIEGIHRIQLTEEITLDIVLGDIKQSIQTLYANQGLAHAWFLDGFAPSKNEGMWQPAVFKHIARLSCENATFATFTAAGIVKRGLKDVGFEVKKRKGFGRKRDMLVGQFLSMTSERLQSAPWYARANATKVDSVTVVGAGLAGLLTAYELLKRGYAVQVISKGELGDGASGNFIGGFYPQLQADYSVSSMFYIHCFEYARHYYSALKQKQSFDSEFCGVLQLAFNQNVSERQSKMQERQLWPEQLVKFVEQNCASKLANVALPHGGIYLPEGGWISPISLVKAIFKLCSRYPKFNYYCHTELAFFNIENDKPIVQYQGKNAQQVKQTDALVLATGDGSKALFKQDIDFRVTRGQVEYLPTNEEFSQLQAVICHKGYFTPALQQQHALGSTYTKNDTNMAYRKEDKDENLSVHMKAMPLENWQQLLEKNSQEQTEGRAAIRCSTPDHLPVVGNMPDFEAQQNTYARIAKFNNPMQYPPAPQMPNVFILSGLGSRGLTTAPLCATLIANQIDNQPLPLSEKLLNAINPNRFLIRELMKKAHE
ncbi:bifunctional tRNA (5-methylaminomethyl-2-thiouridine)(34)-methyltransferase MnmD/FAD-dependent 5-carboxymethylaminomethyl-2-thiouridine(34) oxidoreductase MnmC [Glaciecola sp. 1036]|uniref:bifunctional tRNA (5-methylaminomethyl-2-thiouridine)(34)-methyltransferase MnmD/FAD-dependent 5-carboxymethylaminomethyl-2-thiouridine(34) oxidoreductase MnmC n=1 Tax=Alteromonadaceae TaxID=72275 RepID=UPI003CFC00BF